MNKIIYSTSLSEIIPSATQDSFFLNSPNISNSHIIKTFDRKFLVTPFEESILYDYYLKYQNWGMHRNLNLESKHILSNVDFARFYFNFQ